MPGSEEENYEEMFKVFRRGLPYLEYDPIDHSIESILMVEEYNVHHHKPEFIFFLMNKIFLPLTYSA